MDIKTKIEARLVEDWREAWRWSSVQLALLAGVISGWAASDPGGFARVVDLLPDWARPLLGLIVTASAIATRLKAQKNG
ncbi:hypothetical protein [Novosphingobium sp. KN65.2]|uniref:DUF7940 domain-containing protein n=1 Tax=Novosphingobium sp. KN65.2 TaxID=1478134 RepID=UPI0005E72C5D|nr:hypothetical protein [Novosphingobium sp. KN65.2]CDO34561.1 hypothetical protein SPHV1_1670011 [Novosphingobium sp. KN65.2]